MLKPLVLIKNRSNTIQITDEYRNLKLLSHFTLPVSNLIWQGSATVRGITVVTQATIPMVAVRCATHSVALFDVTKSGNVTTMTFYTDALYNQTPTIEVFIFDEIPANYQTVNGMTVWKRDRKIAFDSDGQYARIAGMLSSNNYGSLIGTHTYPVGKKYAVAFSGYSGSRKVSAQDGICPGGQRLVQITGTYFSARIPDNRIILKEDGISTPPRCTSNYPGESEYFYTKAQLLVLDVTGY